MYNEEIKQQFLDTLEHNSRRLTTPIFNKIEAKEEEYNTDYCKMTRSQIIDTIAMFGTETNIRPAFSRLRKYSSGAVAELTPEEKEKIYQYLLKMADKFKN